MVADAVSGKLGTKVSVGRVDLGFINRLIIDDVYVLDQKGERMLRVARLSAKVDPIALIEGRISLTSAQFFGLQASLYQERPDLSPNYQFVLDSLASKDNTKSPSRLDLQIGSVIIRHGAVSYRRRYKAPTPGRISFSDLSFSNISGHLILNRLTNDSLDLKVKKFSFDEKSGLKLKSLSLHVQASDRALRLSQFRMELPHSVLALGDLTASYRTDKGHVLPQTLQYEGSIAPATCLVPCDFSFLLGRLRAIDEAVFVSSSFSGTASGVRVKSLGVSTRHGVLTLKGDGSLRDIGSKSKWNAQVTQMTVDTERLTQILKASDIKLPAIAARLGNVRFSGSAGGSRTTMSAKGNLHTAAGDVRFVVGRTANTLSCEVGTANLSLGKLLDNSQFGQVSAQIAASGHDMRHLTLRGNIGRFDYGAHEYRNIKVDGSRAGDLYDGLLSINDPDGMVEMRGHVMAAKSCPSANLTASVRHLSPTALRLTDKWGEATFDFDIGVNLVGADIHTANGKVALTQFVMHRPGEEDYAIDSLLLCAGYRQGKHFLSMNSDFGHVDIRGHFNYFTLPSSICRLVGSKLPTLPGLPKVTNSEINDFEIDASIRDSRWMQLLLGVPLRLNAPAVIAGSMDDRRHEVSLQCRAADFVYGGAPYRDASLSIETPSDTLKAVASVRKLMDNGKTFTWNATVGACANRLSASVSFHDSNRHPFKGTLNASAQFMRDDSGRPTAYIDVDKSVVTIGDTTWHVQPSSILYRKGFLEVRNFNIRHEGQYISVSGRASDSPDDALVADLKDVDVRYVLDLVNFHSVDFDGLLSGRASVTSAFSKRPQAEASLTIDKFLFEGGRMGVLTAHVGYDNDAQQIDIDAIANDSTDRSTRIEGYVSPQHNTIDLSIIARGTRLEFMESFCGSFMRDVNAQAEGAVRLSGLLSNINLTGQLVVNGSLGISSLNTNYALRNDTVRFVPDEILFRRDTIYDRNGNIGIVEGNVHHKHLTNLSYDLGVEARNLLSYDTHTFGDNTFYGTAYATGRCSISGRSGEVVIDINATPNPGSIIVYNVGGPDSLSPHEFLQWVTPHHAADSLHMDSTLVLQDKEEAADDEENDVATDIRLNFLISCTPDATIKLIMDERTGDYITLNGDGVLRASYFNKGAFDLYGNYVVDHGLYKLTVQNVIKRDFTFLQGGTIAFGGDPYNADLHLKAQYTLNSVSLSDLNIGRSFTSNNIRVNCLMNVTGTPNAPKVDFDIDLPSLSNDAKQMVYSVINAEEEMNQQVLYLLAVGRFYTQGSNNAATESVAQYSQTSLAMQSILSGTISQQLNTVLSSVINSSNWNVGANISTGTEGFNDAEYEGLLSGRMLNNRLLFNGQFGYRDNANATTGFIGDFDLRYLLFPNGNLSINVYNKTNDRYFTRNTLTTQGLGLVMKKDFSGLSDLFGIKKKKKTSRSKKPRK